MPGLMGYCWTFFAIPEYHISDAPPVPADVQSKVQIGFVKCKAYALACNVGMGFFLI